MRLLDLTLPAIEENLALDEALVEEAELAGSPLETLRFWESPDHAVVIGRASKIAGEVNLAECERLSIPVRRRSSGGCAVVIGPGCLMYSVVLSYELHPELQMLDQAHVFVMSRLQTALAKQVSGVSHAGTCDLVWQGRKFSGNSLRCKRTHLLYHGTILYDFDLSLAQRFLLKPPREPEYREKRSHEEFITNVQIDASRLKEELVSAYNCDMEPAAWPETLVEELMQLRYTNASWHAER